jgi:hypothetical protein
MIALIVIGVILLLIGLYVAMPEPLPVVFKIIGIVLLVWGLILLALYLIPTGAPQALLL